MSRMSVFALAAALALGSVAIATEASAKGGSGMHSSGGSSMHSSSMHTNTHTSSGMRSTSGMGSGMHHHHHNRFFFGGYAYYPYASCLQWRHVSTPRGWRWVRVDLCNNQPY
jgi:hypothetical protein